MVLRDRREHRHPIRSMSATPTAMGYGSYGRELVARFSEMFVKQAIVAGHDSFELLPRLVGPAAREADDHQESVAAFLDRRDAVYRGS